MCMVYGPIRISKDNELSTRIFFFGGPVNVPGIITQMHILIAFHWAGSAYKNVGHCAQRAK